MDWKRSNERNNHALKKRKRKSVGLLNGAENAAVAPLLPFPCSFYRKSPPSSTTNSDSSTSNENDTAASSAS